MVCSSPLVFQQSCEPFAPAYTYAAWRWLSGACLGPVLGTWVSSLWVGSDPFLFGDNIVKQARSIPTIARRPPTIPQYPHDICHTLA